MVLKSSNDNSLPKYIWINGKIIKYADAKIHVMSPAARYGFGLLEGLRGYWNHGHNTMYVVQPQAHYRRLMLNARVLGLSVPFDADAYNDAIRDIIQVNNYQEDIHIRNYLMVASLDDPFPPTVGFIASEPIICFIAPYAKGRLYNISKGARACISSWERVNDRSQPPRLKTGANYLNARLAKLEAIRHGYDTAIFLNALGKVSEGPGETLLIVRDGTLIAPSLTSDILEGITRSFLLKIAQEVLGIDVDIRYVDRTELYMADEALLCGSGAEIVPVIEIDGLAVGEGRLGPVTIALQEAYQKFVQGQLTQYMDHLLIV